VYLKTLALLRTQRRPLIIYVTFDLPLPVLCVNINVTYVVILQYRSNIICGFNIECFVPYIYIHIYIYTGWRKKRPEHFHALFSRMVEMNQLKSIYVMSKRQRICVEIFA